MAVMNMSIVQALKLAIELVDAEHRRFAMDNNFYINAGARYPHAIRAHERCQKLELARDLFVAAIEEIQARQGGAHQPNDLLQ